MKETNIPRRRFLAQTGIAAAGLLSLQLPSWAKGMLPVSGVLLPQHNIPADKNLNPAWVKSLYERGLPTTYLKTKNELRYIGMPAGGLHAGTVYLGGDGRLWLWSIYNDEREGIDPKMVLWNNGSGEQKVRNRDGASYVEPAIADNKRVLDQGFAILLETDGETIVKELKEGDWAEVAFEATYPLATIRYSDPAVPVEVMVKAGGIFIPLDADESALPAVVYDISIKNRSAKKIQVSVAGWLENGARKITGKDGDGEKLNTVRKAGNFSSIFSAFKANVSTPAKQDDGSTCITYIGNNGRVNTNAAPWPVTPAFFRVERDTPSSHNPSGKLTGSIAAPLQPLEAGASAQFSYALSWHFNQPLQKLKKKLKDTEGGYYYGKRFADAGEVGAYIAGNFSELWEATQRWQQTYYDSTLPHWLLERALLNIGTLATANTYRFASNRFWGWEGVNACEGTCTHVWQYAQAMGRIFPTLERDTRQRTDLAAAMQEDGGIIFRAEYETRPAIDGQAGTILRIYREHQMCADDSFLRQNWEQVKKAVRFMLAQDKNGDGMTDTPMENTLDAVWEGEIAWIVGLCIAAAKAAWMMAEEMKDKTFAATCRTYVEKGSRNMSEQLFNGEYFIHKPDKVQGRKKLGSYNTCHIDQVYGQSWAFQVGLGRLWDKEKTIAALRALWKYNFTPDVGPYIKTHTGGRPYAVEGEGGMVMNTNPHNEPKPYGEDVTWQLGYFHECMSGFEHQVASHMMAEGMTDEALVLTRAIHDRYHAAKRNPYNEIECSDHYARAMASYGTFITACGFEYHGPKGYIRMAPQWQQHNFKAPFTAAEGWGSYTQQAGTGGQQHAFEVKYGSLQLKTISLALHGGSTAGKVTVMLNGKPLKAGFRKTGQDVSIELASPAKIGTGETLHISIS